MSGTRFLSEAERREAPRLPITLPDFPDPSPPFSIGERTELYTPEALKKVAATDTTRTDRFIKLVYAISHKIGGPVPFAFYTADGRYHSLDAGCVGYCVNENHPRLSVATGNDGFIVSVMPTARCAEIYELVLPRLLAEIDPD